MLFFIHFLAGMGSIFGIGLFSKQRYPFAAPGDAITHDWKEVGGNLERATHKVDIDNDKA